MIKTKFTDYNECTAEKGGISIFRNPTLFVFLGPFSGLG